MNTWMVRYRQSIVSRCERDGWRSAAPRGGLAPLNGPGDRRFANWMSSFEGKRDQMVERLLARTLASYMEIEDREEAGRLVEDGADYSVCQE